MTNGTVEQLVYLVILGTVLTGWILIEHRKALSRLVRTAFAWGFIFVGVIAAYGLWSDIRDDLAPRQAVLNDGAQIEVPRGLDGHYYLTLELNDRPVRFVVDTGASDIVLTQADAARIGIDPGALSYIGVANTANGQVPIARALVDRISIGPVTDENVRVSVNAGEMDTSLLGMRYLQRFERLEITGNRLILTP